MDLTSNAETTQSFETNHDITPAQTDPESSASNTDTDFPVKVIDEVNLWAPVKLPEGVEITWSPACDVSVVGYPGDKEPLYRGIKEIADVVKALENRGIHCCMVEETALAYYGSMRVMDVSVV